jgi:hypothetical protein
LEQLHVRDLLDQRVTDELPTQREKYLQVWSEKCYGLRDSASPGKHVTAVPGSSRLRARRSASSSYSKEDADLDGAGKHGVLV